MVRKKFARPEAEAISSGRRPDTITWFSGTKKQAMPMPMRKRGTTSWPNGASVGKLANQIEVPPNTMNANVVTARNSSFWMFLPMIGEIRKARMPTGAVASPAHVAV